MIRSRLREWWQSIRKRRQFVGSQIDFVLDGWRRRAYWTATTFIGVAIGIRWGHPDIGLPFIESVGGVEDALFVANSMAVVAEELLVAIVGREALIDTQGDET